MEPVEISFIKWEVYCKTLLSAICVMNISILRCGAKNTVKTCSKTSSDSYKFMKMAALTPIPKYIEVFQLILMKHHYC